MASAASLAASSFFPISPPSSSSSSKSNVGIGAVARPGPAPSRSMAVRANAQALPKINGVKNDSLKPPPPPPSSEEEKDVFGVSPPPRTFYNQLPDWSVLLAAITTIFLAAEKQWTLLDWKPRRPDVIAADAAFGLGRIVHGGLVFRQNFSIRSYEIGADRTASIETLMNHLQETALNHVRTAGLLGDGFGATPEMSRRSLIWVVSKMQVFVEYYPSWGDVVEVDTWVGASGKNGMGRDWHVRNIQTGRTIMRATSIWVMMNKNTRKLSKMPEEVRAEIGPHFVDRPANVDEGNRKLPKLDDDTADYIRKGLSPRWGDLDVNQHVNNVKYIGWILESVPISLLESHELASVALEYRRECGRDSMLQSLTAVSSDGTKMLPGTGIRCNHMLRLECGDEILRARTEWRPKRAHGLGGGTGPLPAGGT
ncbi:palmitoyl-acyl carrier protein thioesterase, chloroplastic-like [Iris pallida]|uniref:Acyl-[acyl-carrier-protein] hydrolase n=1 Tax=Iris pallida TaxID=29817 RepID=A0AAX6FUV6_IRIPA|nr:palmitoyl-acyl carrier protein thioesterase, chloroplastic-like [Iris pallida]